MDNRIKSWSHVGGSSSFSPVQTDRLTYRIPFFSIIQGSIKVTTEQEVSVQLMSSTGIGVWVALNRGAILYLYHPDMKKPLQEIDTRGSLETIAKCEQYNTLSEIITITHMHTHTHTHAHTHTHTHSNEMLLLYVFFLILLLI